MTLAPIIIELLTNTIMRPWFPVKIVAGHSSLRASYIMLRPVFLINHLSLWIEPSKVENTKMEEAVVRIWFPVLNVAEILDLIELGSMNRSVKGNKCHQPLGTGISRAKHNRHSLRPNLIIKLPPRRRSNVSD